MPTAKLTGDIWTDHGFLGHTETSITPGLVLRQVTQIPRGLWFVELTISLQLRHAEMLIQLEADGTSYGVGIGSSLRTAPSSLDSVTALTLLHDVRVTSSNPQMIRIGLRQAQNGAAHGAFGYTVVAHRQRSPSGS